MDKFMDKNFLLTGAEMKVSRATHPPDTKYVSVRPEEETTIVGSRGRTSIDFHFACWCGALVLWLRRNFDFVSALLSVSCALWNILQNFKLLRT